MNITNPTGNCWPTPLQEQLLKACLLDKEEATEAWIVWSQTINLEKDVDVGSYRLLPLLYQNLRRHQIETPFLPKLKSIYQSTWRRNQIIFHRLKQPLNSLHLSGISVLLLKGMALTLDYYQDEGVRYMVDVDLLVSWEQVFPTIAILKQQGWNPTLWASMPLSKAILFYQHSLLFRNSDKGAIDLHWNLHPHYLDPTTNRELWENASRVNFDGIPVYTLSPTDTFFHICVHGVRWNKVPPLRWVADAYTVLKKTPSLDWDRLIFQAQQQQVLLPLEAAITYLTQRLPVHIPPIVVEQLQRSPVTRSQTLNYQLWTQPPTMALNPQTFARSYFRRGSFIINNYLQWEPDVTQGERKSLLGFLKMLQVYWDITSLWKLPWALILRIIRMGWRMTARLRLYQSGKAWKS